MVINPAAKAVALEAQIDQLLDRIVETTSGATISAFERRIAKLEREKAVAQEAIEQGSAPKRGFVEMFELACRFSSNPWNIWQKGDLEAKRIVLKLAFEERLPFDRKTGFRTPIISLPFKALGENKMAEIMMAENLGSSSNTIEELFQELSDWNDQLKNVDFDIEEDSE